MPSVLVRATSPYRASEAWIYDTVIAPAVSGLRDAVVERFLAALPEGARMLDVGCGGGQLALAIAARRPDLEIVGLDLSPEQVGRAKRRGRALAPRVRFLEGSALELPFSDASFDAVLSVASIKHWPDQARGLRECVRVLRPGGALAVVEADRGCRLDDARRFVARWRMPAAMRPLALVLFRTFVAGQGLDLEDARALLAPLPLADRAVERVPGTPGLVMTARRA